MKMTLFLKPIFICSIFILVMSGSVLNAQQDSKVAVPANNQIVKTVPVAWDTFVRAETDKMFNTYVGIGGLGKFFHIRSLTPIDKQDVVRMNRDTRYSIGVFDLTNPVTVTLPDSKGRYISMQVINEDEYTKTVEYNAGDYTITKDKIGTRYVCLIVRILVNGEDVKDNEIVTGLQNSVVVKQSSPGTFEIPNWDQKSQDKLRDAIKVLASTLTDTKLCFGDVNEVDPIAHLLGAAYGWGGNPANAAIYLNVVPENNDGKTNYSLTVKDVPVDGFWSISIYNKAGYFEKNQYNAYVVNSATGIKEKDGSIVIHFGGNPKQSNYLPITDGWNYIVRLYRAKTEIINGSWVFPGPVKVN